MTTHKKYLSVFTLIFVLIFSALSLQAKSQYSPVVQELKNLYDSDESFQELIDNALSSAVPTPDGWSKSPYGDTSKLYKWPQKDIDDLLYFFESWRTFVPNTSNGMMYYELLYGLCYENPSAIKFVSTEPGLSWTRKYVQARGAYMDSTDSIDDHIPAMKDWKKALGDKWNDFKAPHATHKGFEGYTTFNEFFTRELLNNTIRPVSAPNDPSILVSPADGLTNVINSNLNSDSKIHTKYDEYLNVSQLLAGSKYANRFNGGTATATVLLPNDYHHYHSPVEGLVVETKEVDSRGGVYFGMDGEFYTFVNNGNIGGYKSKYGVFGVYHRGYYIIKTKEFGYVAMIPIGLDDISSVNFVKKFRNINSKKEYKKVKKGEIVGNFAYGGSTVILLFETGVFSGIKLQQGSQLGELNKKQ